jgi:hypothetical protein
MSLTESNLLSVAKTQYRYKTKANAGIFFTLIAAQLLALVISFNGVASSGGGTDTYSYTIRHISGDIIIIFTLIWAFVIGINMASSSFRMDFTFISSRLSSHISSLAFLLTAATIGGLAATLSGVLLRVIIFFSQGGVDAGSGFWIAPLALLSGTFAAILYTVLLSIIGYFTGMLTQRNRAYAILLPGLFIGTLFVEARSTGQSLLVLNIIEFFTKESAFPLFTLKVILVSALLFGCVLLFSDRMEVRK